MYALVQPSFPGSAGKQDDNANDGTWHGSQCWQHEVEPCRIDCWESGRVLISPDTNGHDP